MTTRNEAAALVELGMPVIERAFRYHATWSALEAGRVPAKLRREVLDHSLEEGRTEALAKVRAWDGSDVPLIMIGGVGIGKSFAAACWLRDRAQAGESIAWISATELGSLPQFRDWKRDQDRDSVTISDEEKRANKACATVLDDLGAGALSASVMRRINAIMLTREAQGLPTLALLNASKDDVDWLRANLDPRLLDRMRGGGSRTIRLPPADSLRGRRKEQDNPDPKTGRGRAWKASAALLRTIGVEDDFDGRAWEPGATGSLVRPIFGHRVERVHSKSDDWPRILGKLCEVMCIDVGAVRARAAEIGSAEAGRIEDADRVGVDLGLERGRVVGLGGFVQRLASDVDADRRARVGEMTTAGRVIEPRPVPRRPVGPDPVFADGEKARLAAMGYTVKYTALCEFELHHRMSKEPGEKRKPKTRLLSTHATELLAWDAARNLQRVEDDGQWAEKSA